MNLTTHPIETSSPYIEELYEFFDVTIGQLLDRARLWGANPVELLP